MDMEFDRLMLYVLIIYLMFALMYSTWVIHCQNREMRQGLDKLLRQPETQQPASIHGDEDGDGHTTVRTE